MKPIETAAGLYREIKRRGLHLREKNGRDNALLQQLTSRLGCPDTQLQSFLDTSDMSAEAFLRVFLQLAAPFARMFQEIWDYLNRELAPKATETISVRFGFEDSDDQCSIDLEQFRRYVNTAQRVVAPVAMELWPLEALHGLFPVGRKLTDAARDRTWELYEQHGRYEPGKPYDLPSVPPSGHPFDDVVVSVRDVFKHIIDGYVTERCEQERIRRLPELTNEGGESNDRPSLQRAAFLLTDLLPTWFYILDRCSHIPARAKDDALDEYESNVKPLLTSGTALGEVPLLAALDVLDLPFWRHRWHTYEVWATVLTLRLLDDYRPALRIQEGYVPLDGYSAAVIADLKTREHPSACVAVQIETPFERGKRKAIKPDLRICFADPIFPDNTAGVFEFKQRCRLDSRSLREMATAYTEGCPNSGGCVILNYDRTDPSASLPPRSRLIEDVQPLNRTSIEMVRQTLHDILQTAGIEPLNEEITVLLDVSYSMGDSYQSGDVQRVLREILAMSWVRILRFNDCLVEGGDLDAATAKSLSTGGGTQLGRALSDIESIYGLPSKLLIVTDGEHDHPRDVLSRVPTVRECLPSKIGDNMDWLRGKGRLTG